MNPRKALICITLLSFTLSSSESFATWRRTIKQGLERMSQYSLAAQAGMYPSMLDFQNRADWAAKVALAQRIEERQFLADLDPRVKDFHRFESVSAGNLTSKVAENTLPPDMASLGFNFPHGITSVAAMSLMSAMSETPAQTGATAAAPSTPPQKDNHSPCNKENHHVSQLLKSAHHAHAHFLEIHKKLHSVQGLYPPPFLAALMPQFEPPASLRKTFHTFIEYSEHDPRFKNALDQNPNDPELRRKMHLWNTSTDEALDLHTSYETGKMIKDVGKRLYLSPAQESKKILRELKTWAIEKNWGKDRELGKELLKNISEAAQHSGSKGKSVIACLQIAGIFVANFGMKVGAVAKNANNLLTTEKEAQKMTARAVDDEKLLPQHRVKAVENTAAGYSILNFPKAANKGDLIKVFKAEKGARKLSTEEKDQSKTKDVDSHH